MSIEVYIEREQKRVTLNIEDSKSILDLLKELKINKETVIVAKDGNIVIESEKIGNAKKIDILSVVSGG